jgi:hypothetical protein
VHPPPLWPPAALCVSSNTGLIRGTPAQIMHALTHAKAWMTTLSVLWRGAPLESRPREAAWDACCAHSVSRYRLRLCRPPTSPWARPSLKRSYASSASSKGAATSNSPAVYPSPQLSSSFSFASVRYCRNKIGQAVY